MPKPGDNLPGFRATQIDFAAHIRNPLTHPRPVDVEERRMRIYRELFYSNIESFLASGFPVAKRVLEDEFWGRLVREFVHRHRSESPYFLEISQEFLSFLNGCELDGLPGYLLELCHYEWVELYLNMSADEIPEEGINPEGDLLAEPIVRSPLVMILSYRYPVHRISAEYQPSTPPEQATHLVVYRKRDDQVRFLESNQLTHRLLQILEKPSTGNDTLDVLSKELSGVDSEAVKEQGAAILVQLCEAEILLGTQQL